MARFEPGLLGGLNCDGLHLVVVVDRSENDGSYRKQSKLDNLKRGNHLRLENCMETAALFSLAGVNSVLINRWSNSFHANKGVMNGVVGEMCAASVSVSVGEAVGKWRKTRGGETGGKLKERVRVNTVVFGLPNIVLEK